MNLNKNIKTIIQIGCGKEPDQDIQRYLGDASWQVFLVEANKTSFSLMSEKIRVYNNTSVDNLVISTADQDVSFFVSENFNNDYAQSSVFRHHLDEHVNGSCDIIESKTKGVKFNSFCREKNIQKIDYLIIDTEGHDAEILRSIDFSAIDIRKIKFEIMHILTGSVQLRDLIPFFRGAGFNQFVFYFEGAGNITIEKV